MQEVMGDCGMLGGSQSDQGHQEGLQEEKTYNLSSEEEDKRGQPREGPGAESSQKTEGG